MTHYKSKKDILFLLLTSVPLTLALITFVNSLIIQFNIVTLLIALFIAFGLIWFIYSWSVITYEISEDSVKIKAGNINLKEMATSDIKKIRRSYNFINHFTTSFKRLRIDSADRHIYTSPKNEKEFVGHILKLNHQIEVSKSVL